MKIEDNYFPWDSISDKDTLRPSTTPITAAELQGMVFPPLEWIVQGILPNGITLLAADPKAGKTRIATNLALAITRAALALEKLDCKKRGVLCLFLEDNKRSMQRRIEKLLPPGEAWPENLILVDAWPEYPEGLKKLDKYLGENPFIRVVIVDTWDKIRPLFTGRGSVYQFDTKTMGELRSVIAQHGVDAFLLHHTNRGESKDKFKRISGTQGLFGSVDTGWVLERNYDANGNMENTATLEILGREVEPQRLALEYDPEFGRWTLLGDAAFYLTSDSRQAILDYIAANPNVTPKQVATALGRNYNTTKNLMRAMFFDRLLNKDEEGRYWVRE